MNYEDLEKKHHLLPGEGKRWVELAEQYSVPLENEEEIKQIYGVDFSIRLAKEGDTTAARDLLSKAAALQAFNKAMPPNLREYIAECLLDVVKGEPFDADRYLNIRRAPTPPSQFYRDMQITADIRRAEEEIGFDKAVEDEANKYELSVGQIRKIYNKHIHAINALITIGELDNVIPPLY